MDTEMQATNTQPETRQLLQPFDLRGITIPNRVVMAPLTRSRAGENRIANQTAAVVNR